VAGNGNNVSKHLERLHELPCVVCSHMGMPESWPVEAHHLESVRDGMSDYAAIPLCGLHHRSKGGVHGLSRRGFEMRYKLTDIDLLALTIRALEKAGKLR
jgi:hypothetical protein